MPETKEKRKKKRKIAITQLLFSHDNDTRTIVVDILSVCVLLHRIKTKDSVSMSRVCFLITIKRGPMSQQGAHNKNLLQKYVAKSVINNK